MYAIGIVLAWIIFYFIHDKLADKNDIFDDIPSSTPSSSVVQASNKHLQLSQNIDTFSMDQSDYQWSEDKVANLSAALQTMSCESHANEKDDCTLLFFQYQSENLVAVIREKRLLVEIHDPYWYEVDPRDIDKFAEMMHIINIINITLFGVTLSYTLDKEKNIAQVITAAQIPVFKDAEQTRSYLDPVLRQFFHVHKMFLREMAKCGMLD